MEEENKRVSYSQFKECTCKDLKMYFSDPEFRKQNYEVKIRENIDDYDSSEELLYLYDLKKPDKLVPEYSLSVSYETYCRSGNLAGVIKTLATTIEKQYPKEHKTLEVKEKPWHSKAEEVEGYPEEEITAAYLITDPEGKRGVSEILQDDDTLAAIAEKEKCNLQVVAVDDKAVLAIPVSSEEEMEDNLEVMSELQHLYQQELGACQLYDRNKNLLLSDLEEIKELLAKGKERKKSVFSKQYGGI